MRTPSLTDRIVALLEQALLTDDPELALAALTGLRRELDLLERRQVARALEAGRSFSSIAAPLGISRQAAHRRYRGLLEDRPRVVITPEARLMLGRACAAAMRAGSPAIGTEHLQAALERELDAAPATAGPPLRLEGALRAQLARCGATIDVGDLRAVAYQSV